MRAIINLPIIIFLSTLIASSQGTLDSGLVAYYPFTGNANDSSVSGNHGTVNGATLTTDRFGNSNSAYFFDGIDDHIVLGTNLFSDNEGTITAWINKNNMNTRNPIFSQGHTTSDLNTLRFTIWEDSLSFVCDYRLCGGGSAVPTIKALPIVPNTQWVHVALSSDGLEHKFFINGNEYGYTKGNNPAGDWFDEQCSGNKTVHIGRWKRSSNDEFFNGKIDELRIYNRTLSDCEIYQLFTENTASISTGPIIGQNQVSPFQTENYSVSQNAGSSYNWTIAGGNILSGNGTNGVGVQWGVAGSGQLNVEEIDSAGCNSDTSSLEIAISTGITELNYNYIHNVYPNPFSLQTTFVIDSRLINRTVLNLRLYNTLGQEVISTKNISTSKVIIRRGNLQNGLYFYMLTGEDGTLGVGKIVIE